MWTLPRNATSSSGPGLVRWNEVGGEKGGGKITRRGERLRRLGEKMRMKIRPESKRARVLLFLN